MADERPLERIGKNLRPFPVQLVEQLIPDPAGEPPGEASGQGGRARLAREKSLAVAGA